MSFGAFYFDGNVDELRISNTNRSAAWITTVYNNQNSPGTFIMMGSENALFSAIIDDARIYKRALSQMRPARLERATYGSGGRLHTR